ncbi:Putative Cell wall mannoprotein [Septoria linicola]|uniref:Cell wall mannoprotein n=1 Tax=Septoria linicola TaxID=215465 RepID=A0A9Q9ASJ7_9PEZI|nr:putative Cell wall mannoprotein [Septoria linicola]USW53874.1 Putative Cell wall mannoprotein [Septoria linicola]
MFQAVYNVHLKDRLRGKRLRSQLEQRFNPNFSSRQKDQREMIGITNLFILATAALATIVPKDTAGVARVHADIETINAGLSTVSNDIKNFDPDAIVDDLRSLGKEIIQAGKDVAAGDAVSDTEALAITFYVKNAMAPVVDETILDLRKAKMKITRAGRLEDVTDALQDLGSYVIVLGAALLSKTPEGKKAEGKEVLDGIVTNFQDAVKYLQS